MIRRPSAVRVVVAAVLVISAAGFGFASHVERRREAAGASALNLPEGSAAREAAERGAAPTTTQATASSVVTSSSNPAAASTTTNALAAPEGSSAREAAERAHRSGTTAAVTAPSSTTSPSPSTTATTAEPTTTTTAVPAAAQSAGHTVGETLFGLNTESVPATTAAIAALLLAAAIALVGRPRWLLLAVVALAVGFAILDVREAVHQHDEARTNLVAAAAALAAAHAIAGALALAAYRNDGQAGPLEAADP